MSAPLASIGLLLVMLPVIFSQEMTSNRGIRLPVARWYCRGHHCGMQMGGPVVYISRRGVQWDRVPDPALARRKVAIPPLVVADADLPFGTVRPVIESVGGRVHLATRER